MSRSNVVAFFSESEEFKSNSDPQLIDFILEQGRDDLLVPGGGDASLSGGLWSDRFIFTNDGAESTTVVTDLEPWDELGFGDFGLNRTQILNSMEQSGSSVVFNSSNETIIFLNTELSEITQDMILV
jgi:hypothetical protein